MHERLNIFSGTIDGFDRWPNEPYKWGYIGGTTWTSRDQKLNLVIGGAAAYDQLPDLPPGQRHRTCRSASPGRGSCPAGLTLSTTRACGDTSSAS